MNPMGQLFNIFGSGVGIGFIVIGLYLGNQCHYENRTKALEALVKDMIVEEK